MWLWVVPLVLQLCGADRPMDVIKHIIVIVQENWSLDGLWTGLTDLDGVTEANYVPQVTKEGVAYTVLPRPTLSNGSVDTRIPDNLPNLPWQLTDHMSDEELTRDLVHRFYTHQFQINKGKLDKFVAYSDAGAYVVSHMGKANNLPMASIIREGTLATRFFQAAFGGSFLSHQWLISGRAPEWNSSLKDPPPAMLSVVDFESDTLVSDEALTVTGEYAINTIYSETQPYPPDVTVEKRLPPSLHRTMGDLLTAKNVSWKWYSGGWDNVNNSEYDPLFQYHHQPYIYYKNFEEGTEGRKHLVDEQEFYRDLKKGTLPSVSWVKFYGADNEHPGYATVVDGQKHLVDCVKAIQNSSAWENTLVILTYDEFGGRFDHVVPPKVDEWGPGSRVSSVLLSPFVRKGFMDRTEFYTHDSINKLIADRFHLEYLTERIAKAQVFENPFDWTGMCCPGSSIKAGEVCRSAGCTDCCVTNEWMWWGIAIAVGAIALICVGAFCVRRFRKPKHEAQVLLDTNKTTNLEDGR
jgi:phospholipase C